MLDTAIMEVVDIFVANKAANDWDTSSVRILLYKRSHCENSLIVNCSLFAASVCVVICNEVTQ